MNKWGLIFKAAGYTGVLLFVRLAFDYLNYDVLSLTNLITGLSAAQSLQLQLFFPGY
jgi:hypothetical protein